jgi:hypothetical protein
MHGGGGAIGIAVNSGGTVIVLQGCSFIAGAKGLGYNDIARYYNYGPSSVTFLCGDGFVGAPVKWSEWQRDLCAPTNSVL